MPDPRAATTEDIAIVVDHLKRTTQNMGALQASVATLSQSMERLVRNFSSVASDVKTIQITVDASRQEMISRFSAVGERFVELENAIEAIRSDIKTAAADIIAQELQILNAVQSALGARIQMDELATSLQEVRTQLGM